MVRYGCTDGANSRLIKKIIVWAVTVAIIAIALILFPPVPVASQVLGVEKAEVPTVPHETVEAQVEESFDSLISRLAKKYGQSEALARKIVQCESKGNLQAVGNNYHWETRYDENGEPYKVKVLWSSDHGPWQINDYWNAATAKKRGYNIYNWRENLEFGFIMLKEQGTSPWLASKYCWNV